MKRTLILYASTHHGNTRRLAEAMAEAAGAELCDLLHDPLPDLSGYDLIGMASGIYYGKLHPRIPELLRQLEPRPGQRVFLAYTCGIRYRAYEKPVLELLRQKGIDCAGCYACRGYDTFGPFGKIGGIARGRPSAEELRRRLVGRGTETIEVINARLRRAAEEAAGMEAYDYLLINDKIQPCVEQMHQLIQLQHNKTSYHLDFLSRMREDLYHLDDRK